MHWGTVHPNGSSGEGMLGDILRHRVDVGAAELFNFYKRNPYMDPSSEECDLYQVRFRF